MMIGDCECDKGMLSASIVARHLSDGAFTQYLTSRRQLVELRLQAEKDKEIQFASGACQDCAA